jgi:hypothetical protein
MSIVESDAIRSPLALFKLTFSPLSSRGDMPLLDSSSSISGVRDLTRPSRINTRNMRRVLCDLRAGNGRQCHRKRADRVGRSNVHSSISSFLSSPIGQCDIDDYDYQLHETLVELKRVKQTTNIHIDTARSRIGGEKTSASYRVSVYLCPLQRRTVPSAMASLSYKQCQYTIHH